MASRLDPMSNSLHNDPLLEEVPDVEGYKVLEPCVLYSKVGQGGMGAVYKGKHLNLEIDVAVKCLKRALAVEGLSFIQRFQREARIAASIHHQNLVQVYDVSHRNGVHYLVMEFVCGETGRDRVRRKGALAESEALNIMRGAAAGLAEAHTHRIVHRDVKPDNILISQDGRVKVSDLGLAKALEAESGNTLTQGVMGTPQYMAPEQWEDAAHVGPPADVWALGATLYFLLAGKDAIAPSNMKQVCRQICVEPFPDIRLVRKDLSEETLRILAKCVATDAKARYPDCRELLPDLERALAKDRTSLAHDASDETRVDDAMVSPPPPESLAKIRIAMDSKVMGSSKKSSPRSSDDATDSLSHVHMHALTPPPEPAAPPPPPPRKSIAKPLSIAAACAGLIVVAFFFGRGFIGAAPIPTVKAGEKEEPPKVKGDPTQPGGDERPIVAPTPTIELDPTFPGGVGVVSNARVTLTGHITNAPESGVWIEGASDAPQRIEVSAKGAFAHSLALPRKGQHTLRIRAEGSSTTPEVVLTLDSDEPSIEWIDPVGSPARIGGGERSVKARVRDATRVVGVRFEVGSLPPIDGAAGDDGVWSATLAPLGEGIHPLRVHATDEAGNTSAGEVELQVDTTGPRLVSVTPSARDALSPGKHHVRVEFDEALADVRFRSGPTAGARANGTELEFDVIVPEQRADALTVELDALDDLGNSLACKLDWRVLTEPRLPEGWIAAAGASFGARDWATRVVDPRSDIEFVLTEIADGELAYVACTETTRAQWRGAGRTFNSMQEKQAGATDDHPITFVSGREAAEFCAHYGYRLPTVAEWQRIATQGAKRDLAIDGDAKELDQYAWLLGGSASGRVQPVGQLKPSHELFDVHGNVWELCTVARSVDGKGATFKKKGGSVMSRAADCRVSETRNADGSGVDDTGFRVLYETPHEPEEEKSPASTPGEK